MTKKDVNVGLIGFGFSGKNIHSRLIAATPGMVLHTVCDKTLDPGADLPFSLTTDPQTIFDNPEIDLVVIATPNLTHFPLAESALKSGKHVVIDKPFTVNLKDACTLESLAAAKGKIVCSFQNRRWDSDFLTVSRLLKDKTLGELRYFESNYTFYQPEVRNAWRETKEPGSGVWFDLGAHLIDQMLQLFGEPLDGYVNFGCQREGAVSPDFFHALFIYPQHRAVLQGNLLSAAQPPRFHINGTQGSYVKYGQDPQENDLVAGVSPKSKGWGVDQCTGTLTRWQGEQPYEEAVPNAAGNYPEFYKQLAAAIHGEGEPPVKIAETLAYMSIIEHSKRLGVF